LENTQLDLFKSELDRYGQYIIRNDVTACEKHFYQVMSWTEVQNQFVTHLEKNQIYTGYLCRSLPSNEKITIFLFQNLPPKFSLTPIAFAVKMNTNSNKIIEIIDPYLDKIIESDIGGPIASNSVFSTFGRSTSQFSQRGFQRTGLKLHSRAYWTTNTTERFQGGQAMQFRVRNMNAVGTNITIVHTNSGASRSSLLPPGLVVPLDFDYWGCEPMTWNFDISTTADTFLVEFELYSTWVPGDPDNC
jgi:hypothetical protein